MKRYTFYDRDILHEDAEQDFTPQHYESLARCCFKHSATISLVFWEENTAYEKEFEPYRIPKPECIQLEQLDRLTMVPPIAGPSCSVLTAELREDEREERSDVSELWGPVELSDLLRNSGKAWDDRYTMAVPRFYRACPGTFDLFLRMANSIFQMQYSFGYRNPEDPAFFRKDGSVFFTSCVHEGECSIFPRPGEDISELLSHGNWILTEE